VEEKNPKDSSTAISYSKCILKLTFKNFCHRLLIEGAGRISPKVRVLLNLPYKTTVELTFENFHQARVAVMDEAPLQNSQPSVCYRVASSHMMPYLY